MIMSTIVSNLQAVDASIVAAAQAAGRARADIKLLAVSKTFPAEAVLEAVGAGQTRFGENYLQEALDKMVLVSEALGGQKIEWHFIGPLQSNKTRPVAESFDWVHTVDRLKIAQRLSDQRPVGTVPLNICLQVNISGEASKSGVKPEELAELALHVAQLPRLRLRGLMAIPEATSDPEQQRAAFARLRHLYEALIRDGISLDTLSMGMSADLGPAVLEGATIVRVGSAIFGSRNYET